MSGDTPKSIVARQAELLLRALAEDSPWDGVAFNEVADGMRGGDLRPYSDLVQHGIEAIRVLPPEQQAQAWGQLERLAGIHEGLAYQAEGMAAQAEAKLTNLRAATAAVGAARDMAAIKTELRGARLHEAQVKLDGAQARAQAQDDLGPPFSLHVESFIARKAADDGWDEKTCHQSRATMALWLQMMGDTPVRSVTAKIADGFLVRLRSLPAGYGKDVKSSTRKTAAEWLVVAAAREAAGEDVARMTAKTAKRHFSALSQYWQWLRKQEHVQDNAFRGHEHAGAKTKRKNRDDWSDADIIRMLCSPWLRDAPRGSHRRWLVLLAAWTGARVEEIARLRPCDVQDLRGHPALFIEPHDGWSPKSEAGERVVPLHPAIIGYGFMSLVERRRAEGAALLWPELRPSGPSKSLSAAFTRDFSRYKTAAGVGRKTTFHSLRASVRTSLEQVPGINQSWIDAIMGHEGESASVGISVYLKRIGPPALLSVAQAVTWSEPVMDALSDLAAMECEMPPA